MPQKITMKAIISDDIALNIIAIILVCPQTSTTSDTLDITEPALNIFDCVYDLQTKKI